MTAASSVTAAAHPLLIALWFAMIESDDLHVRIIGDVWMQSAICGVVGLFIGLFIFASWGIVGIWCEPVRRVFERL